MGHELHEWHEQQRNQPRNTQMTWKMNYTFSDTKPRAVAQSLTMSSLELMEGFPHRLQVKPAAAACYLQTDEDLD